MHSSAAAMHWAARLKALPRVLHSVPDNKLSICNYLPPPDIRPPPSGGGRLVQLLPHEHDLLVVLVEQVIYHGAVQYKFGGAEFRVSMP